MPCVAVFVSIARARWFRALVLGTRELATSVLYVLDARRGCRLVSSRFPSEIEGIRSPGDCCANMFKLLPHIQFEIFWNAWSTKVYQWEPATVVMIRNRTISRAHARYRILQWCYSPDSSVARYAVWTNIKCHGANVQIYTRHLTV